MERRNNRPAMERPIWAESYWAALNLGLPEEYLLELYQQGKIPGLESGGRVYLDCVAVGAALRELAEENRQK